MSANQTYKRHVDAHAVAGPRKIINVLRYGKGKDNVFYHYTDDTFDVGVYEARDDLYRKLLELTGSGQQEEARKYMQDSTRFNAHAIRDFLHRRLGYGEDPLHPPPKINTLAELINQALDLVGPSEQQQLRPYGEDKGFGQFHPQGEAIHRTLKYAADQAEFFRLVRIVEPVLMPTFLGFYPIDPRSRMFAKMTGKRAWIEEDGKVRAMTAEELSRAFLHHLGRPDLPGPVEVELPTDPIVIALHHYHKQKFQRELASGAAADERDMKGNQPPSAVAHRSLSKEVPAASALDETEPVQYADEDIYEELSETEEAQETLTVEPESTRQSFNVEVESRMQARLDAGEAKHSTRFARLYTGIHEVLRDRATSDLTRDIVKRAFPVPRSSPKGLHRMVHKVVAFFKLQNIRLRVDLFCRVLRGLNQNQCSFKELSQLPDILKHLNRLNAPERIRKLFGADANLDGEAKSAYIALSYRRDTIVGAYAGLTGLGTDARMQGDWYVAGGRGKYGALLRHMAKAKLGRVFAPHARLYKFTAEFPCSGVINLESECSLQRIPAIPITSHDDQYSGFCEQLVQALLYSDDRSQITLLNVARCGNTIDHRAPEVAVILSQATATDAPSFDLSEAFSRTGVVLSAPPRSTATNGRQIRTMQATFRSVTEPSLITESDASHLVDWMDVSETPLDYDEVAPSSIDEYRKKRSDLQARFSQWAANRQIIIVSDPRFFQRIGATNIPDEEYLRWDLPKQRRALDKLWPCGTPKMFQHQRQHVVLIRCWSPAFIVKIGESQVVRDALACIYGLAVGMARLSGPPLTVIDTFFGMLTAADEAAFQRTIAEGAAALNVMQVTAHSRRMVSRLQPLIIDSMPWRGRLGAEGLVWVQNSDGNLLRLSLYPVTIGELVAENGLEHPLPVPCAGWTIGVELDIDPALRQLTMKITDPLDRIVWPSVIRPGLIAANMRYGYWCHGSHERPHSWSNVATLPSYEKIWARLIELRGYTTLQAPAAATQNDPAQSRGASPTECIKPVLLDGTWVAQSIAHVQLSEFHAGRSQDGASDFAMSAVSSVPLMPKGGKWISWEESAARRAALRLAPLNDGDVPADDDSRLRFEGMPESLGLQ